MKEILKELPLRKLAVFACAMLVLGAAAFWRLHVIAVPAFAEVGAYTYILDAGHGGEDGGAAAADGTQESGLNLAVTMKLDQLLHLLGQDTVLVRERDEAVYSAGCTSFAEKKVSDLHNRAKLVNETPGAFLLSIHQNQFPESKYYGAQVFYNEITPAKELGEALQEALRLGLAPENHRQAKSAAQTVYLMRTVTAPAVLVECGFLSNPAEAEKLKQDSYQTKLALVIANCVTGSLKKEQNHETEDNVPVYELRQ